MVSKLLHSLDELLKYNGDPLLASCCRLSHIHFKEKCNTLGYDDETFSSSLGRQQRVGQIM